MYDLETNYLKVLRYCKKPQSRFSILEHIELYNNSKNFNAYLKPLIAAEWLTQTIPEKPTSKQQQYFTSALGNQLVSLFDHENKKGDKELLLPLQILPQLVTMQQNKY